MYVNRLGFKLTLVKVAHKEIDLKNPKTNTKTAGFTKEERDSFDKFLSTGFVDSYRHYYPKETDCYTFWAYRGGARQKGIGWYVTRKNFFKNSKKIIFYLVKNFLIPSGVWIILFVLRGFYLL